MTKEEREIWIPLILDGSVCQWCQDAIDGEPVRHPRTCHACKAETEGFHSGD
jgi:hypothetical protein